MRIFMLAVAACVAANLAHAGYRGAEWGMTPEQVASAIPEAKLKDGREYNQKRLGNAGSVSDGTREYTAAFYYDDRGLAVVELRADYRECQAVLDDLVAVHGRPYRVSDQVLFRLIIWHDPPQNNRLRLMVSSAKVCTLYYERLDDYKAADDAQVVQGR